MSVISGIGTAAPQMSPSTVAVTAAAGVAAQAQTTSGTAAPPAVVVSLSGAATASAAKASPTLRSMDPTAVETALARLSGANGLAFIAAHWDYALTAAKFGVAIAERNEKLVQGAAAGGASMAISAASFLGSLVQDPVGSVVANLAASSPAAAGPGASSSSTTSGYFTVSDFSFTSGGSIYSITTGANGMVTGTKDGQYWMAVGLIPSGQPGNQQTAPLAPANAAPEAEGEAATQDLPVRGTYAIAGGTAAAVSPGSTETASAASASSPPTPADPSAVAPGSSKALGENGTGLAGSIEASQPPQLILAEQPSSLPNAAQADAGAAQALKTLTALNERKAPTTDLASAVQFALRFNSLI
jgi:hypothetical protein